MIIKHIAKVHKINEISNIRCAKLSIPFLLPIVLLHLSPDSGIEDASLLIFLSIDLLFPQSTATPTPLFGKMITIFCTSFPIFHKFCHVHQTPGKKTSSLSSPPHCSARRRSTGISGSVAIVRG